MPFDANYYVPLKLQINFLLGSDRKPWVWVMGEHEDDLPYDEIVSIKQLSSDSYELHFLFFIG